MRKYRADLLAFLGYVLLALLLTYPLVTRFATHVAGDGSDDPALAWNLWWVPYAILNLNASPIYTDYMFYPIGLNLAFYTPTYLNAILSIPIQSAFNLVSAANVNLLLAFTLGGFGTYLLVKYLVRNSEFRIQRSTIALAAFVAGALYAFSSNKMLYASLGQFNIASSQWIPLYVLFLLKLTTPRNLHLQVRHSIRYGFLLGLFLLFQALSEFIFASFLIIFTALYLVYSLIATPSPKKLGKMATLPVRSGGSGAQPLTGARGTPPNSPSPASPSSPPSGEEGDRGGGGGTPPMPPALRGIFRQVLIANRRALASALRLLLPLLIAALTFLLPMLPVLAAMLRDMLAEGDFIQSGLGFADVFSSDGVGFFVPSHLHPFFGGLEAQFHFAYTNFAYLGFIALALAVLALWKMPRARIWGVFGAIFIVISLGPALRMNGALFDLPLPFDILLEIPFVKGNRYPSRWSVMVTLALAVLVGYGIAWLLRKFQVSGFRLVAAACVLLFALLFEHLSVPLPLSNFQIPPVYQTIAQDKGDFTVLEIPLAWRNGFRMTGTLDSEMMFEQWYQTQHRRPILGGNTSRNPELKFQYFTESPVINSIIAVETGHMLDAERMPIDKQLAPDVLGFFGVRYVVWHSPRDLQNRAALDAARAYIEQVLPVTKFYDVSDETGRTIAYRVTAAAEPDQVAILTGEPLARLNFAEGWGALSGERFIWAQRREAKIFVRIDTHGRDADLALSAVAPPGLDEQPVTVIVNGQPVGRVVLTQCLDCKTGVTVPADVLKTGMNEIVFQFDRLVPAAGIHQMASTYMVALNGPHSPVNLTVQSAGSEVGDFAHIYVDGRDVAPNRRGYNIAVIDPQSGAVEASAAFDTFASEGESARLAQFVKKIPNGRIVAVAVRDEASRYLTQEAVDALRTIGAEVDLRDKSRWSHAIIGAKGAAPGSVWEAAFETWPAQVNVGIGATEPSLAAAVERIEIRPK